MVPKVKESDLKHYGELSAKRNQIADELRVITKKLEHDPECIKLVVTSSQGAQYNWRFAGDEFYYQHRDSDMERIFTWFIKQQNTREVVVAYLAYLRGQIKGINQEIINLYKSCLYR